MSQTLSLSTDEILDAVATVAGLSRTYANWDSTQEADARLIIRSGLRRFYNPPPIDGNVWQWRFLEKRFNESAEAVYDTGTIAIAAGGTVTLTGGAWPSWAADGVVRTESGETLFVSSRTSDSVIVIENDSIVTAAGEEYELHRWRVALPIDFGDFLGGVLYNHASHPRMLRGAMEPELRLRYVTTWKTGATTAYALIPPTAVSSGVGVGTARGFISWYPTMDTEAHISGAYRANPQDNLDNADIRTGAANIVQIDAVHAQTLLEAILASAEEFYGRDNGIHHQLFGERLQASINYDRHFAGAIDFSNKDGIDLARLARLGYTPTYPV